MGPEPTEELDVVVIGAGISGIGAGYYLQAHCPSRSFAILEGRERIGGTWDLFRYPGIRSDSDMQTLGFAFKPWDSRDAIAGGPAILDYLEETVEEFGLARHIRLGQRVTRASWSSTDSRWTITVREKGTGVDREIRCQFLLCCAGYYRYEAGHTPEFRGVDSYRGRLVHPQHWPRDLDYRGKRIVVIGSGATAVTLVPAMADDAAHVTMVQRSPSYVISVPGQDPVAEWLRDRVPDRVRFAAVRWKNIFSMMLFYHGALRFPGVFKKLMVGQVAKGVGPHTDVARHFTPDYNPWQQRVCLVPDGNLFTAIRSGRASVVTGHIDTFTPEGVRLTSGEALEADVVITATGLHMELFSGMRLDVDGAPVDIGKTMAYRAMMLGDVPNLAFATGYTNASWTLKVDIVCRYICRLLNHMEKKGYDAVVPVLDPNAPEAPLLAFTSGYVRRALPRLPRGGAKHPWRVFENYLLDRLTLGWARIEDGVLEFRRTRPRA